MESILIIVIPVLILMGYYLALVSNRLRLDAYSKHVVAEVDQLNSFLENDVKSNNLFYLKNLGFVFLISLLLFWIRYRLDNLYIFQWACGCLLIIPLRINSIHLSNILVFRFVRNNPDEIKGQITQSAKYICTLVAARDFAFLIAIAPMALLSRSFYLYGALTGAVIMPVTNIRWYRRYKKNTAVSSDSVTTRKKSGLVSKIIGRFLLIVAIAFLIAHEGYQFYLNKTYAKDKIDAVFEPITSKYGIKIVYEIGDDFFSPLENPPIPAGPPKGSKVEPVRHRVLLRYPALLQKAFGKYPVEVIKKYLNGICFANEIDVDGFKLGGTYDPFRWIIYMVDDGGNNNTQSMHVFHHEFSSLLLNSHSFFVNPWTDNNPQEFSYLYDTNKNRLQMYNKTSLLGTEADYEKGFMNTYGQTDFGNDFSEYSAMIFTCPHKFKKIMNKYSRVRGKFRVWLAFYQKIDPIFTEQYLLGNS